VGVVGIPWMNSSGFLGFRRAKGTVLAMQADRKL
jgi:hypothetical protein